MLEKNMRYMHSLTDEDTTEYFRYMKIKYADNKKVVDFCDEVLADEKLTAAYTIIYQRRNRALLAKTGRLAVDTYIAERSEIIAEIIDVGLSIMCKLFFAMIVCGIFGGIGVGITAIFGYGENGPLIAIFLLLLFVIIMRFINEWLEGKINEWEDGTINICEKISERIAMVYSDICIVIEMLMAFLFLAGCFILPIACTGMIVAYFLGAF